jgi:hypothetical protein
VSGASWARQMLLCASFGFSPVRGGDAAPEAGVVLQHLDSARRKISELEEAIGSSVEEEGRALA